MFRSDRLIGMVSGLIVWAMHFGIVYALTSVGCEAGLADTGILGRNAMLFTLGAVTLAAFALLLVIGLRGWEGWQSARRQQGHSGERYRFMSLVMLILAVLAFVATIFTSIPMFLLPPCP